MNNIIVASNKGSSMLLVVGPARYDRHGTDSLLRSSKSADPAISKRRELARISWGREGKGSMTDVHNILFDAPPREK